MEHDAACRWFVSTADTSGFQNVMACAIELAGVLARVDADVRASSARVLGTRLRAGRARIRDTRVPLGSDFRLVATVYAPSRNAGGAS
jgi:hypothetical protein